MPLHQFPLGGSVGTNIPKMLELFKTGHEYLVERDCYILTKMATLDMPTEQIIDNLDTIIKDVCSHRPLNLGKITLYCYDKKLLSYTTIVSSHNVSPESWSSVLVRRWSSVATGSGSAVFMSTPSKYVGICKKFAASLISAGIELGNGGKLVSEAISELGSATVNGAGSSSSSISVGKKSSSQEAAKHSVSSSAIKGCDSSLAWAPMGDPVAKVGAGGSGVWLLLVPQELAA
ncbi:UNVERIFIED_CONTAM: hypothetical protein FKN15_028415 [Acipenser sinensis]